MADPDYPVDIFPVRIDSQNWLAFPVSQKWVIILTGIAVFDFKGTGPTWNRGTLHLDLKEMVQYVFDIAGRKPSPGKVLAFQVQEHANFATINSIWDQEHAVNAGFAVDGVSPVLLDYPDVKRAFRGLNEYVAVSDIDAHLYRVGSQATVVGWIVETSDIGP